MSKCTCGFHPSLPGIPTDNRIKEMQKQGRRWWDFSDDITISISVDGSEHVDVWHGESDAPIVEQKAAS